MPYKGVLSRVNTVKYEFSWNQKHKESCRKSIVPDFTGAIRKRHFANEILHFRRRLRIILDVVT